MLDRLEVYAGRVSRAQFEADLDTWLMVSRALELVAQCCVYLGMEIVSKRGLGVPETYREPFVRLAQSGILSPELSAHLQGWAGLRNVLAHLYTTVDLDRLLAAVLEDKAPLRAFGRIAARELKD
jgi:uncharacterized protein YutE (UPF0331/DUF86 family)